MNKRIKGLYDQADKFASQNRVQNIDAPGNNYFELFHEKFAELIVQECCSVVKPSTEYPTESVDIVEEFHRGYWVGCTDSTYRIKDHFGVEE